MVPLVALTLPAAAEEPATPRPADRKAGVCRQGRSAQKSAPWHRHCRQGARYGRGSRRRRSALSDAAGHKNIDHEIDDIAGSFLTQSVPQALRHEMVPHYVGFAFWDVLTFTLLDRISPLDAVSLRVGAANSSVTGAELRHLAGFLSRSLREDDYLWGRLDAAKRSDRHHP
jgi:hypothetical protein